MLCLIQTQLLEQDPIGTGARLESKLAQGYRGADSVIMTKEQKVGEMTAYALLSYCVGIMQLSQYS